MLTKAKEGVLVRSSATSKLLYCHVYFSGEQGCSITIKNLCSIYQPTSLDTCQGSATVLFPLRLLSSSEGDILLYFHGRTPQKIVHPQTQQLYTLKEPRYKYDQILEQIIENKHYNMMAIIPHGSDQAQFSPMVNSDQADLLQEPSGFPVDRFFQEVLQKLAEKDIFPQLFQIHGLVLTAHSAGGLTLLRLLEEPEKWGLPSKKVRMVALLDAVNGSDFELPFLEKFLTCSFKKENQELQQCSFFKNRGLDTSPFYFRAYYTNISPYPLFHEQLRKVLDKISVAYQKNELNIKSNFRILSMNKFLQKQVGHSEIVKSALRYTLRVLPIYHP